MIEIHTVALGVRSVFCLCVISAFVSLVVSHVCSLVLSSCFLVPAMCFPMFVCLCHVPSCCCPCLHPSPVPNLPVCLYYWYHLCPVNSSCLVHLCLCHRLSAQTQFEQTSLLSLPRDKGNRGAREKFPEVPEPAVGTIRAAPGSLRFPGCTSLSSSCSMPPGFRLQGFSYTRQYCSGFSSDFLVFIAAAALSF